MGDNRPFVLIVLDGWGLGPHTGTNAITNASTPNMDRLFREYSHTKLQASGEHVGLPAGQIGGSEVGHLNLGAGRIPYQDLTYINKEIETGGFFRNPVLNEAMRRVKESGKKLHLMGLLSPGGVHSHTDHIYALLRMAKEKGLESVFVHAFLDGRDVPPTSAKGYLEEFEKKIKEIGAGRVATVIGRYWAMDRDNRWERTARAYNAMVIGDAEVKAHDSVEAISRAYDSGESDEFVSPTVILHGEDRPVATIDDGDSVIFYNFRADRAVQITKALLLDEFKEFDRVKRPRIDYYACFMEYIESMNLPVAFKVPEITHSLPEYFSRLGMRQLRIAETEKFRHVTLFFNAGREEPFPGEERVLIPSPKVATYDLKPEMSAYEITEEFIRRLKSGEYDFIVMNYANADMVGHTGIMGAAVKAIETVDSCVGRSVEAILEAGGTAIITADHGNADRMKDERTGEPHTAHTMSLVPCIIVKKGFKPVLREEGTLGDVAPTILEIMEIRKPEEMTGESLIRH